MRFFKSVIESNCTYKRGLKKAAKQNMALTRPSEWDGIHIVKDDNYYIVLKTGEVLVNPSDILDTKKKDWAIVEPTARALEKINNLK